MYVYCLDIAICLATSTALYFRFVSVESFNRLQLGNSLNDDFWKENSVGKEESFPPSPTVFFNPFVNENFRLI